MRKSLQLLSVSAPSGNRPALVLVPSAVAEKGPKPLAVPGAGAWHPLFSEPETPWYPSPAHGSTDAAVVEAIDNEVRGVAQYHAAFSEGDGEPVEENGVCEERGASEPLVGCRRSLVARGGYGGVTDH